MTDLPVQIIPLLTRAILPPLMAISITGAIINIVVLTRPTLYNHPCSRYFLALAANNLFFSVILLTYNLLSIGYQIDPTIHSSLCCKIILHIQQASATLSPQFIVLASMDRYFVSSSSIRRRNLSNVIVARWLILSVIMIITLFYISSFVSLELRPNDLIPCQLSTKTFWDRVYPMIQAFLISFLPAILMSTFGALTVYNQKTRPIVPIARSCFRRTDQQLLRMLIVQVSCHTLVSMPMCIIYILGFLPIHILSPLQYYFALRLTQLIYIFSYIIPIVLYFFSSRVYRQELMNIIKKGFRFALTREPKVNHTISPMLQTSASKIFQVGVQPMPTMNVL